MKKIVIGNWKMNPPTLANAKKLVAVIERKSKHVAVICPPVAFLSALSYPRLGAQDCFWQISGAYTGQISPVQLKSLKAKYCLVGHSEKRALGETDEMVNLKVKSLLTHGLIPVLCVGFNTQVQQDDLEVTDVLKSQLKAGLKDAEIEKVIVAYEPVWAIGTGRNASPEHAEKIAIFIKHKFGVRRVIYGGSVNPYNAKGFLDQENIDGLLVGGASLIPKYFNQIINL